MSEVLRAKTPLRFATTVHDLAEVVVVPAEAVVPRIAADPDDDQVLACAIVGKADYLISYDRHLLSLGDIFQGLNITRAVPFLQVLRQHRGEP